MNYLNMTAHVITDRLYELYPTSDTRGYRTQ